MSSFLFTNTEINNIIDINTDLVKYGKDLTEIKKIENYTLIYNHLFTQDYKQQYLYDDKNKIICIIDGFLTNTDTVLTLYKKYGYNFYKFIDGEYSIIVLDKKNNLFLACSDPFGCRHLSIAIDQDKIGASTFCKPLKELNFKNIFNVYGNTVFIYDLKTKKIDVKLNTIFDTKNPYKTNFNDWIIAFEKSINKKINNLNNVSLSLSDGYDSGMIHCALIEKQIKHDIYSLVNLPKVDSIKILLERHNYHSFKTDQNSTKKLIFSNKKTDSNLNKIIHFEECIDFDGYTDLFYNKFNNEPALDISGIDGIMQIANLANKRSNVLLTGIEGEIHYMPFNKNKYFLNFSVSDIARASRLTCGCFGLDARFVFLDKDLYQEAFWISPLILKEYKAIHKHFLKKYNYPFFETIDSKKIPVKNNLTERNMNSIFKRNIFLT